MFRPGDIVTLKEPDIGEEKDVIFVCYTKLYDDEFDCVLIERYGMEKNSTFRYYIDDSNDYELSPNTEFYTKDEIGFAKMLTSLFGGSRRPIIYPFSALKKITKCCSFLLFFLCSSYYCIFFLFFFTRLYYSLICMIIFSIRS